MSLLSTRNKSERLKALRRKARLLSEQNARLKSYIEALEPMAVRSLRLTPTQLRSVVRRRQSLNLASTKS